MFTDGACYFQAAQGAPPPRYDVKPLEVLEVERPAVSLDASFRAGIAEVEARMAREQQQQLQWLQAAQAASQQAVHAGPAAGRDVDPGRSFLPGLRSTIHAPRRSGGRTCRACRLQGGGPELSSESLKQGGGVKIKETRTEGGRTASGVLGRRPCKAPASVGRPFGQRCIAAFDGATFEKAYGVTGLTSN